MRGVWLNEPCLDFFKRGGGRVLKGFGEVSYSSFLIPPNWRDLEEEWSGGIKKIEMSILHLICLYFFKINQIRS